MIQRHQLIKQRRETLGISKQHIANLLDITEATYDHVERDDTELTMVIPLKGARLLAQTLGVDLDVLLNMGPVSSPDTRKRPRHRLTSDARRKLGVSIEKMANDIGFEPIFVVGLENDDNVLDAYPFKVTEIVANYLKIPVRTLVNAS